MKRNEIRNLTLSGMIAALYIVLTFLAQMLGLASGTVQIRLSEALCLLPCLTSAAIPGLGVGCLLANILTGCAGPDILFGTLATVLGAVGTRLMSKRPGLCWIPPVAANTLIIPFVLRYAYGIETAWPILALSIFAGETVSCCVLGLMLLPAERRILERYR